MKSIVSQDEATKGSDTANPVQYTKHTATNAAIDRVKGQISEPGTIVATRDEPRTWNLDGYDGDEALLSIGEEKRRAPKGEIFDVKKVINVANHLLNVGFWAEGMESTIITLA